MIWTRFSLSICAALLRAGTCRASSYQCVIDGMELNEPKFAGEHCRVRASANESQACDFWRGAHGALRPLMHDPAQSTAVIMIGDSICRHQFFDLLCSLQAGGAHVRLQLFNASNGRLATHPDATTSRSSERGGRPKDAITDATGRNYAEQWCWSANPPTLCMLHVARIGRLAIIYAKVFAVWAGDLDVLRPPFESLMSQLKPCDVIVHLCSVKAHKLSGSFASNQYYASRTIGGMLSWAKGLFGPLIRYTYYRPATIAHFPTSDGEYIKGAAAPATIHRSPDSQAAASWLPPLDVQYACQPLSATARRAKERLSDGEVGWVENTMRRHRTYMQVANQSRLGATNFIATVPNVLKHSIDAWQDHPHLPKGVATDCLHFCFGPQRCSGVMHEVNKEWWRHMLPVINQHV